MWYILTFLGGGWFGLLIGALCSAAKERKEVTNERGYERNDT